MRNSSQSFVRQVRAEARNAAPLVLGHRYRRRIIQEARKQRYDIVVVGGGINGAGIAYEASMRGYHVLLLEKGDFASGTSSRSSKLIHGGMRYLRQLQFGLVFESLRERRFLLQLAPHLVEPLPFLYPVFSDDPDGKLAVRLGMWLYDVLSLYHAPKRHTWHRPGDVKALEPELRREGLRACPRYYDARTNDARLVLATILSAVRHGADVLSYGEVRALLKEGDRVTGVLATDRLGGGDVAVEARLVINAAGPWLDRVVAFDQQGLPKQIAPTKGVHFLVPRNRFALQHAVVIRSPADNRVLFAVPWERMTLVGTTDTFFDGDLDEIYADKQDIQYLLRAINQDFPNVGLRFEDILSTYAGVRPLIGEEGKGASEISREHHIFSTPGGMLSIGGGKLTTFRSMAIEVVNKAARHLEERVGLVRRKKSYTHLYPFEGGATEGLTQLVTGLKGRLKSENTQAMALHLARSYGVHARAILDRADAAEMQPLIPGLPYSMGELAHVCRHEFVGRLEDLFFRRTNLYLESGVRCLEVAEAVATQAASILGWDRPGIDGQLETLEREVRRCNQWASPEKSTQTAPIHP